MKILDYYDTGWMTKNEMSWLDSLLKSDKS